MSQRLLTLAEVAERLRRSPAQLRWMRHNGTGPRSAKIAGRAMYLEADIDRYIEQAFADECVSRGGAA